MRRKMTKSLKKLLVLTGVLGISCGLWAQTDNSSWAKLSALLPGQKIQILEMNSEKHSGTYTSVSDRAISYQDKSGEQIVQRQDVRSVKLMKNKHRLVNTLVLGGVGAGVGAGIGAATYHPCSAPSFCIDVGGRGLPTAVGAAVGLVGGLIAGALLPGHETIYSVKAP
jgi:hypothetical protein